MASSAVRTFYLDSRKTCHFVANSSKTKLKQKKILYGLLVPVHSGVHWSTAIAVQVCKN